jgi:hypothetical protein
MKEQPGEKKLFMATSQSRDLESFSTELGELVPRSVALFRCHTLALMSSSPSSNFIVIGKSECVPPWGLAVAVSRVKREMPDRVIEGNRAWKAFATNR